MPHRNIVPDCHQHFEMISRQSTPALLEGGIVGASPRFPRAFSASLFLLPTRCFGSTNAVHVLPNEQNPSTMIIAAARIEGTIKADRIDVTLSSCTDTLRYEEQRIPFVLFFRNQGRNHTCRPQTNCRRSAGPCPRPHRTLRVLPHSKVQNLCTTSFGRNSRLS